MQHNRPIGLIWYYFFYLKAGFVAALPFVARALLGPICGIISDTLRRNGVRTKTVRRMCFGVGKDETCNRRVRVCSS